MHNQTTVTDTKLAQNQASTLTAKNQTILSQLSDMRRISQLLRILGACAVLASISVFLLNGWSEGNDINRYLKLLTQTALLTAAGFGMAFILREYKSARIFFGLSLISVTANFTILGALVYSLIQLDNSLLQYPDFVTWKAVNTEHFLMIAAAAVIFLALVCRLSFTIFNRQAASILSLSYLGLNALLLIPVRHSSAISAIILIGALAALYLIKTLSSSRQQILTNESKFAFATLLLPTLIITARAISLYQPDTLMLLTLAGIAFIGLKFILNNLSPSIYKNALEAVQLLLAFFIAVLITETLPSQHNDYAQVLFAAILILLNHDTITNSDSQVLKNIAAGLTALILVTSVVFLLLFEQGFNGSVIAVATGLMLLVFAKHHRMITLSIIAILTIIIGIAMIAYNIISVIELNNWISLGVMGATIIVGASLLERHGVKAKLIFKQKFEN